MFITTFAVFGVMMRFELALTLMLFKLYVPPWSVTLALPRSDTFPRTSVPDGIMVRLPTAPVHTGLVNPRLAHDVAELIVISVVGGTGFGAVGVDIVTAWGN